MMDFVAEKVEFEWKLIFRFEHNQIAKATKLHIHRLLQKI
jgi:hypothetical protein